AVNTSIENNNHPNALPVGEYIKLVISDEGCGIPAINLKNIFDPYFTTKSGGSGLGLASVQSIISKHGGHIYANSEVGKGTTFEIMLPACKNPSKEAPLSVNAATGSHDTVTGASLLVMDDEEMIRNMTVSVLEELG